MKVGSLVYKGQANYLDATFSTMGFLSRLTKLLKQQRLL